MYEWPLFSSLLTYVTRLYVSERNHFGGRKFNKFHLQLRKLKIFSWQITFGECSKSYSHVHQLSINIHTHTFAIYDHISTHHTHTYTVYSCCVHIHWVTHTWFLGWLWLLKLSLVFHQTLFQESPQTPRNPSWLQEDFSSLNQMNKQNRYVKIAS